MVSNASKTARPTTTPARASTTSVRFGMMPLSMITPSRIGYDTVTTASSAAASRKISRSQRYGRA